MGLDRDVPVSGALLLFRLHHLSGAGHVLQQLSHPPAGSGTDLPVRRVAALQGDPGERRGVLAGRPELADLGDRGPDRRYAPSADPGLPVAQ